MALRAMKRPHLNRLANGIAAANERKEFASQSAEAITPLEQFNT